MVNGKRELVSILPLATDGTIALTTDSGATHVTVDLLGYFVTPGGDDVTEGRLLAPERRVALSAPRAEFARISLAYEMKK